MAAPGSGIVSTYLGNRYARLSGTSMSAPFVAAGAAMALAANPGLSNAEVASLLRTTATDLGLPGRDDATGAGLLHLTRLLAAARAANDPPLAAFRAAPKNETLNVNASGSSDADGTIVAHSWEWGDGSRGMGAKASHLYGNPGTYTVRLVVTDDDGATGTTTQRVVITAPLHVGSIAGNSAHINATQHRVAFRVTVADAEGAPVAGAQVSGNLTTPSGRTVALTATSNTTGVARLAFDDPATSHGTYRLCVTAITKAGWRYDSASNTARCAELATT
jgi:PKD repeat protein